MATPKADGVVGGVARLVTLLHRGGIGGRGRRSSLSRWLAAHHDDFAAMLADKEPSWREVAVALAAMGLRDGRGQPPSDERVRKAWWGVCRARAAARARPRDTAPSPPLAPGEIAPAVLAVTGPHETANAAMRPRLQLDIRPALPRTDDPPSPADPGSPTAPAQADSAAAPGAVTPAAAARAQLDRIFEQMDAFKVPVPEVVR